MAFELPPLPYDYNALEPYIDEQTTRIHHDKYHNAFVSYLNSALENYPDLQDKPIEQLLDDLSEVDDDDIRENVRYAARAHLNHSMFWENMSPDGGGQPVGDLADAINSSFGSFENLQEQWVQEVTTRLGGSIGHYEHFGQYPGWIWLVANVRLEYPNREHPSHRIIIDGSLQVDTTEGEDIALADPSPGPMGGYFMGARPIVALDLWEHAYLLTYQFERLEYVNAWWNVVNWEEAERRFQAIIASQ